MTNSTMITPEAADETIYRTLCLFMGRGRAHSVEDVEFATKIPARNLHAMIAGDPLNRRRPKGQHILLLASFFGTEFTERLLAPIGQGARELDPADDAPAVVISKLMTGAAEFARAGADGRYCHVDRAELRDDAVMMIQILEPFAAP